MGGGWRGGRDRVRMESKALSILPSIYFDISIHLLILEIEILFICKYYSLHFNISRILCSDPAFFSFTIRKIFHFLPLFSSRGGGGGRGGGSSA